MSDEQLRACTEAFRKEIEEGKSLDDLLLPAFATVREAAKRTLGQKPLARLKAVKMLGEGDLDW